MARVLASELVTRGIRVNTVIPGGTRTSIWTRGDREGATLDATETALSPMIRWAVRAGRRSAQAAVFLASDAASG